VETIVMIYMAVCGAASAVTLILSAYFFWDYTAKKLYASLIWGAGLLLYSIGGSAGLFVVFYSYGYMGSYRYSPG